MADPNDPTVDSNAMPDDAEETLPISDETAAPGSGPVARPEIRMNAEDTFGDYELLNEIARGGMGIVYKARHTTLNRTVALKMILSGRFAAEEDVRRFRQEAEAAANLDHSGIVPIYDVGEHEGRHYFSMKFIEGGSLADKLPEQRKDRKKVVRLIADIAKAIHHAHQRGILHRDLKPANILLDEEGRPLVSDLGLAKQIQGDSALTNTGAVVGTPAYMPPEQAAAKKEITTAADIYSIGAILYEALTGKPPHKADSPMATMVQVLNEDVIRPRDLDSSIDQTLELICLKCLSKEPDQRYSSAAGLAEDLENWINGEPVSVRPPSIGSALTTALFANLRSVIGAGIIGLIAGAVFAFGLSKMYEMNIIVDNPSTEIYEKLPHETAGERPEYQELIMIRDTNIRDASILYGILAAFGTLMFVGLLVAAVTRPKPGSEALAMGLVAAIMMAVALFSLNIGMTGIAGVLGMSRDAIEILATASFGEAPAANEARQQMIKEYPGLMDLPPEERSHVLAFRIFYDGLYTVPSVWYPGIAISILICALPVLVGITFGSKLIHERTGFWKILLPYVEFMALTISFAFLFFLQTLIPWRTPEAGIPDMGLVNHPGRQVFVYSFMLFMTSMIYRGKLARRWRALLYAAFVAICIGMF